MTNLSRPQVECAILGEPVCMRKQSITIAVQTSYWEGGRENGFGSPLNRLSTCGTGTALETRCSRDAHLSS